ncbi:hypothetical protein GYO_3181 [Bacillus spizizenii TU-B-10]|uniref:Uncharacterized protein n=1 Tax=Bacillus spizizenii (strain DSM 15029 / JCM 12233 / NBRC 101239 / NRRL B-23049 / TU-B-10) TaxID=1052585 RepID=G4NZ86_BACS4|nr:hypothetical protein GYO_3181 [Bacillus spizizenii TU-B-10]
MVLTLFFFSVGRECDLINKNNKGVSNENRTDQNHIII